MINYQNWLEYDHNPFILFGSRGEIITLNQSAQYLTSKVNPKLIYETAVANASKDYGYKTTLLDLKYDIFVYFAITVGYENNEEIGIKLYQMPLGNFKKQLNTQNYELASIYILIDAAESVIKSRFKVDFIKELDPSLPDFKLSQNDFIKVLVKAYESFCQNERITTSLKLKTGEFLQNLGKRYRIIELSIRAENRDTSKDEALEELGSNANIFVNFDKNGISLNIPLVL